MNKPAKYSPEVRQRAVRMVFEHHNEYESQWAAIESIAAKIGCTAQRLRKWMRRPEVDEGLRDGLKRDERECLKCVAVISAGQGHRASTLTQIEVGASADEVASLFL